jgi:hypothetical protein
MMINRSILAPAAILAGMAAAVAQEAGREPPYCAELKQVVAHALSRERFVPIAGAAREGNFRDTSLALTGWNGCSLYGAGAYTCDSPPLEGADTAQAAQAATVQQVLTCLGREWAEIKDRSSPGYVVLHPLRGAVSITLSLDENDRKQHVVRLTLFVRR